MLSESNGSVPSLCTGCGLCARACPASNITMENDSPNFHSHCTMCMSCSKRCSQTWNPVMVESQRNI
ncbi:MAG: 4Fe-4S binding protein [Spirochaetales bacterium]|nr:4Fe-4S binding protein [Spirochaetales bacterium]